MEEKLVSVIVPVYNVEKFLEKCVESIRNQTYKNLEIILVDDGSTDLSGKMCDMWSECDERVRVIHKTNGGLSDARNAGLDVARGKYYAFVDSDDYISGNMIEEMITCAEKNLCQIAVCNMTRFSEDGDSFPFYHPSDQEKVLRGAYRFQTLDQPSVCNKLFRAELFDKIRFPKGKYYEDTFIYHEVLYRANSVVMTGKDSYWYLVRKDSIVGQPKYTDRYFDFIEAVWKRAKFLCEHNEQPYADCACYSLYAAFSDAEKNIKKTAENKEKFRKARMQYEFAYQSLKKHGKEVCLKQKIRCVILKYFPAMHSKIYY